MASLPYPRRPPRGCSGLRCTNRALVHQHCNHPTESTEFTEASGVEEPPTDFTDTHRWFGCVGFSHGIHRSFWQRRASHRFHRFHRWLGCVGFSHGFHRCPQMVRLRRVLSRISQNTDVLSGGAAVSAAPTEHSCTNIVILPRKSQNTQKLLA